MGIRPTDALWMTMREIEAASNGFARRSRLETVQMAQAFGAEMSEREIRRYVEGDERALPSDEQQDKLDELKERFNL